MSEKNRIQEVAYGTLTEEKPAKTASSIRWSVTITFQTYSFRKKTAPLGFGGVCTKPIWSCTAQPGIMT